MPAARRCVLPRMDPPEKTPTLDPLLQNPTTASRIQGEAVCLSLPTRDVSPHLSALLPTSCARFGVVLQARCDAGNSPQRLPGLCPECWCPFLLASSNGARFHTNV